MSAIDTQNAKQIRDPMLITCGIAAEAKISLTISNVTGFALQDTNAAAAVTEETWPVRQITDLQGDGFPLDGSCEFYASGAGSEDGKIGLRTHIGGTGSLTVSSTSEIPALTVYTEGEGTITAGGTTYDARGVNVIPVNATSITLTFTSTDAARRMTVSTIIPGINLSWDQDTIISCDLNLRADLAIVNPAWPVSEIELRAYYPDDISEAVTGISDNVPIWYTAGYAGDMSPERRFYISEPVTMENNIITIKGRDASYRLGEKSHAAQIINSKQSNGMRLLYRRMAQMIEAAGIKLRSKQAEPALSTGDIERTLIIKSNTTDVTISNIMNLAHTGTFYPTFVDAGIPKLTHSKPTAKWTIKEEDCGDVTREVDRNINKITSSDEHGLNSTVTREDKWIEIVRRHVSMGKRYSQNAGGYFWLLTVSNARDISQTAESIWWTAAADTIGMPGIKYEINDKGEIVVTETVNYRNECIVKGKAAAIEEIADTVTANPPRAGISATMSPVAYGRVYHGDVFLYPNYNYLFRRSNVTGKFTWKGDPRMQPRDVFTFVRLDGTSETCTIETIDLKHEDGGTVAEITYRSGVC